MDGTSSGTTVTVTGLYDAQGMGDILDILGRGLPNVREVWFYPTTYLRGLVAKGITFKAAMTSGNGDAPDLGAFSLYEPVGPVRRCLKVWRWTFTYGKPITPKEAP